MTTERTFEPVKVPATCPDCGDPHFATTCFPPSDGAPLVRRCDRCTERKEAKLFRPRPIRAPAPLPPPPEVPLRAPRPVFGMDD